MTYLRLTQDPVMRMLLNNFTDQQQETERRCRCTPATNISENTDDYQLEMAVPGFSKEDFRISLEKDTLTVSSDMKNEGQNEDKKEEKKETTFRMKEFGRHHFSRSFKLSESIDKDGIKAEYLNGILTITLPKKEEVKVQKEIQVM